VDRLLRQEGANRGNGEPRLRHVLGDAPARDERPSLNRSWWWGFSRTLKKSKPYLLPTRQALSNAYKIGRRKDSGKLKILYQEPILWKREDVERYASRWR